jgi:hypothetical protein
MNVTPLCIGNMLTSAAAHVACLFGHAAVFKADIFLVFCFERKGGDKGRERTNTKGG